MAQKVHHVEPALPAAQAICHSNPSAIAASQSAETGEKEAWSTEDLNRGYCDKEYIVSHVKLKKVIREMWSNDDLQCLHRFGAPHQLLMWAIFVFSFGMGVLNAFFVLDVVKRLPDECKYSTLFCVSRRLISYTEAVVVVLHAVRTFVDLGTMAVAVRTGDSDSVGGFMQIFVSNLKITSGFSLLTFMPVPPKLLYWFTQRDRLWRLLVKEPPLLRSVTGLHEKRAWTKHRCSQDFSKCKGFLKLPAPLVFPIWLLSLGVWFVSVFVVQVIIPMSLPILVAVAPIAFLVKMASLPDVHDFGNWSSNDWLMFLGTVNQTAKVWSIGEVEQTAAMTIMESELQTKDKKPKSGQLMQELGRAAVQEIGLVRTCVLSVSLDAHSMAAIFGRFLIFDPEGENCDNPDV